MSESYPTDWESNDSLSTRHQKTSSKTVPLVTMELLMLFFQREANDHSVVVFLARIMFPLAIQLNVIVDVISSPRYLPVGKTRSNVPQSHDGIHERAVLLFSYKRKAEKLWEEEEEHQMSQNREAAEVSNLGGSWLGAVSRSLCRSATFNLPHHSGQRQRRDAVQWLHFAFLD